MGGQTSSCSVLEVLAHFSVTSIRSTHLHGYDSLVFQENCSYLYTFGYDDSPKVFATNNRGFKGQYFSHMNA